MLRRIRIARLSKKPYLDSGAGNGEIKKGSTPSLRWEVTTFSYGIDAGCRFC